VKRVDAPNPETPGTQDSTPKNASSLNGGNPRTRLAPQYPLKIDQYWQYNEPLEPSLVVIAPPPSSDTVLDVLGPIPLPELDDSGSNSANSEVVMQYLHTVYKQVSQQAVLSAMNVGEG
jgi:uncharacterized Zn finger protein